MQKPPSTNHSCGISCTIEQISVCDLNVIFYSNKTNIDRNNTDLCLYATS